MGVRGHKSVFEDSRKRANLLKSFKNGDGVSTYHKKLLEGLGFVEAVNAKSGGRGRPAKNYKLTGKGRGYLALAKNW